MRLKILMTRSYGSGWATWNESNSEVADFMLTYQPIIDYLEKLDPKPTWKEKNGLSPAHPLVKQMEKEIEAKFGVTSLCVSAAENLIVEEVHKKSLVEMVGISDFDGRESLYCK